jgi:hypothetical protein
MAEVEEIEEEIETEKIPQVTFLSLRNKEYKLHITPFTKIDGRVGFKVKGNISAALAELQENPSIPILDYIHRMETIKQIVFTLKGKRNGQSTT